jgi:hypothetical protein
VEEAGQLHDRAAGEIIPDTHGVGGWFGLTASLHAMEKRKIPFSCWGLNPKSSLSLNSVGIVTRLRLDDRTMEAQFLDEARDFSLFHSMDTGCEPKPNSYPMGKTVL